MRRPRRSKRETICPNISCDKVVVRVIPRFIDNPPTEVVPYSYMAGKTLIARTYIHDDGTVCDERLHQVRLSPLPKPAYLRLGDSSIDPRN